MGHPLDGVQAKIDRAVEHAQSLRAEVQAYIEQSPYGVEQTTLFDDLGMLMIGHVVEVVEPPPGLGIIAGDFAHNLRGSLDHLVYQLATLDSGGQAPRGTAFPIAETRLEYLRRSGGQTYRDRSLAGVSESHRAMVDAEQPFAALGRWSDRPKHPLLRLQGFSNADKHRLIQTGALDPHSFEATPINGSASMDLNVPQDHGPFHAGDWLWTARVTSVSGPGVQLETSLTYAIGFGDLGLNDGDLMNMAAHVRGLVDRFRPLWG